MHKSTQLLTISTMAFLVSCGNDNHKPSSNHQHTYAARYNYENYLNQKVADDDTAIDNYSGVWIKTSRTDTITPEDEATDIDTSTLAMTGSRELISIDYDSATGTISYKSYIRATDTTLHSYTLVAGAFTAEEGDRVINLTPIDDRELSGTITHTYNGTKTVDAVHLIKIDLDTVATLGDLTYSYSKEGVDNDITVNAGKIRYFYDAESDPDTGLRTKSPLAYNHLTLVTDNGNYINTRQYLTKDNPSSYELMLNPGIPAKMENLAIADNPEAGILSVQLFYNGRQVVIKDADMVIEEPVSDSGAEATSLPIRQLNVRYDLTVDNS